MKDVTKCCTVCGKEKPLAAFRKRKAGKHGREARCKKCQKLTSEQKAYRKEWYLKNRPAMLKKRRAYYEEHREEILAQDAARYQSDPEFRQAKINREKARKVGLSIDDYTKKYDELLEVQAGCCAICGQHISQVKLVMDHRHSDMFIRGLLCGNCNTAIGLLHDNVERAEGAVSYLKSF